MSFMENIGRDEKRLRLGERAFSFYAFKLRNRFQAIQLSRALQQPDNGIYFSLSSRCFSKTIVFYNQYIREY